MPTLSRGDFLRTGAVATAAWLAIDRATSSTGWAKQHGGWYGFAAESCQTASGWRSVPARDQGEMSMLERALPEAARRRPGPPGAPGRRTSLSSAAG